MSRQAVQRVRVQLICWDTDAHSWCSLHLVREPGVDLRCDHLDVYIVHAHVSIFSSMLREFGVYNCSSSRFMKALKAQGMSRDDLPYKAPFQPWGSWFALISTAIITLFKGSSPHHASLSFMLTCMPYRF